MMDVRRLGYSLASNVTGLLQYSKANIIAQKDMYLPLVMTWGMYRRRSGAVGFVPRGESDSNRSPSWGMFIKFVL